MVVIKKTCIQDVFKQSVWPVSGAKLAGCWSYQGLQVAGCAQSPSNNRFGSGTCEQMALVHRTLGVWSYVYHLYIRSYSGPSKMALDFAATYKVLVLGDSNVGKTCIVHRYCDERYYDTYISTIGE
jgi:hypothetical protein